MADIRTFFRRMNMASELRGSTSLLEDRGMHRLPIIYGTDDYILTRDAMWVGYHIPHKDSGFISAKRRQALFSEADNWFASFPSNPENAGHLLVVNHTQTADEWEAGIISQQQMLAEEEGREMPAGFVPYVRLSRLAIESQEFFYRDVFLFVKTNERSNFKSGLKGVLEMMGRQLTSGFGLDDSQPLADEKVESTERARQLTAKMKSTTLTPQPLKRSRVEWLVRYLDSLGSPTPDTAPVDEQEWGIGSWMTTMSAWTEEVDLGKDENNQRVRALELTTTTGEGVSYACFLPLSIAPKHLSPLSQWLFSASSLPFPVDVSLRFQTVDAGTAEKELNRPIDAATAQAMEEAEAERAPDETTAEQRAELERVKRNTIQNRAPLEFWQCVFAVYDTDPTELKRKVAQLRTHYEALQMRLEVPPNDQRSLFYQSFPGSEIIVTDWLQRTNTKYLASALPWLDTQVGASQDHPAFYQGYTVIAAGNTAKPGSPFFHDLVSIADVENRAPNEFVCGDPGSGKTVSRGLKPAHENALKGVTQCIWDPKGDFDPLVRDAEELLLDPTRMRTVTLGSRSGPSLSLDPIYTAEYDPERNIDDREIAARELLRALTRSLARSNPAIRDVIDDAVNVLITTAPAGTTPRLNDVFEILTRWQDRDFGTLALSAERRDEYADGARRIHRELMTVKAHSLGRLFFADPSQGTLKIEPGMTIVFNALNLKEVSPDPDADEGLDSTISRAIQGMITSYIRALVSRLPDGVTKAIFLDEWHVIRLTPAAPRLLDWLRRMGRSKRTSITYLSQSALDAEGGILTSLWCGKCETEENARASCALLGIDQNEYNISVLMTLDKGEFLFRDHHNRVARVAVDFWDEDVLRRFNTHAASKAKAEAAERALAAQAEDSPGA